MGVDSAGLSTTQLPAANAGASFHAAIRIGKFHGMICPTTPSGFGIRLASDGGYHVEIFTLGRGDPFATDEIVVVGFVLEGCACGIRICVDHDGLLKWVEMSAYVCTWSHHDIR